MPEQKIKSGRRRGFVVLYRSAAQDDRLSLEARGLLALMLSLPDNWVYTVGGLARKAGCGREKARRLLKELQTVGYLIREQGHDEAGKFSGCMYVLQDEAPLPENPYNGEAQKTPLPENPTTGEPTTGEPSTEIQPVKNKIEKEEDKKDPLKPPSGGRRRSKYELAPEAVPILQAYVGEDQELHRALGALIQQRVELRAINSVRGIKLLLAELDRLSEGRREDKLKLIRQSILNSWKSVFPLRGSGAARPAGEAGPPREARPYHVEEIDGEEVVVYEDRID